MCGICGIISPQQNSEGVRAAIEAMCSVLSHRGPDEQGIFLSDDNKAVLGMRRLSVIDLKTGSQPIYNEDGSVCVISNGEIYNFREIRRSLELKGHKFKTESDVEVIAHLYEEFGIGLLERLRGFFAFAIWDGNKKMLILARDRIGKKPLYYADFGNTLVFASEIKAVLKYPGISKEPDKDAIHDYLTYQYVPHPRTAFRGINKLPPGHFMTWAEGESRIEEYWRIDLSKKSCLSEGEYSARIRASFEEAVRMRLVSDVPLGAFLSGGLDSSIVVGVMSKIMDQPVKTFSIGFEEEKFNELNYASIVSKKFKTDHKEYIVKPDVANLLPKLAWHYDEPFSDSSAVPSYYLAKMASSDVKVALTGDGGDENFAGYPRHKAVRLYSCFDKLPGGMKSLLKAAERELPEKNSLFRKGKAFIQTLDYSLPDRHARYICIYDNIRKDRLYSSAFKEAVKGRDSYGFLRGLHARSKAGDYLDRILEADIGSYLPGDLLVKMDVASMANSLEARSPFLDHEFMELTASMPSNLKLKGFCGKYILKKAYSEMIPPEVLRRHKMGFGVPIAAWLRRDLKEMYFDTVLSQKALSRGYFDGDYIRMMTSEHMAGKVDHGYRLWALLMLELWHGVFVDG